MINQSDTSHTVYDSSLERYWEWDSLNRELDRVFDICIGCRLCFNLCPSFPALFDAVDQVGDRKRDVAVKAGRVKAEAPVGDRPEGQHAAAPSLEAEFRGEVSDLSEAQRWRVVDLCYQCQLCDPVCPYTSTKEHEFKLDFPQLMTRAQALRTRQRGLKLSDRLLSRTDLFGALGSLLAPLTNWSNRVSLLRWLLQALVGIHRHRQLPRYHFKTLEKWFKKWQRDHPAPASPVAQAAIFSTCFTNYNDPAVGRAAVHVLDHNGVECTYPRQQCCGAPFLSSGDFKGFKKQAEPNLHHLVEDIDRGYKIVVTGPPTCSLILKQDYPRLFSSDPDLAPLARKVSENTLDCSEFLMSLHKRGDLKTDFRHPIGTVNYHLSCHLKAQRIGFKSRDLLKLVPNTTVRMVSKCSGMDGGWGMKREFFSTSLEVGRKCVRELEKQAADVTCSDCTLAGLQIQQLSDQILNPEHPVVTLHRAYGLAEPERS